MLSLCALHCDFSLVLLQGITSAENKEVKLLPRLSKKEKKKKKVTFCRVVAWEQIYMSTLHPLIHPTRLQYIYSMRPENCLESLESLLDFN